MDEWMRWKKMNACKHAVVEWRLYGGGGAEEWTSRGRDWWPFYHGHATGSQRWDRLQYILLHSTHVGCGTYCTYGWWPRRKEKKINTITTIPFAKIWEGRCMCIFLELPLPARTYCLLGACESVEWRQSSCQPSSEISMAYWCVCLSVCPSVCGLP